MAKATPKILLKNKGEDMSKITESVESFLTPIVKAQGCEIVEVVFSRSSLTVYIDKIGGVTLEDCERVHTAIDEPLDELDPTEGKPYTLNVSSPGLDRPIKTDKDFNRNLNEVLEIKLFAPIEKKREFVGKLVTFDENTITLEIDGIQKQFERKLISKATKYIYIGEEK